MSDLFHELVPFEFVDSVFETMLSTPQHTFQILTKRPERMRDYMIERPELALPHVWLGTSIENARFTWRADVLRETPAAIRFISAEPLLGSLFETGGKRVPLDLAAIDWLIAGGESGPHARAASIAWIRELRDACVSADVAFFFKQWGGRTSKSGGRVLDDRLHSEMPAQSEVQLALARA